MLKRNLSWVLMGSALTLPALAHEISFGAGALDSVMFAQLSQTDTIIYPGTENDIQWSGTGTTITGEFYVGYAYNVNKGFDIGFEVFYDLDGPEVEQYVNQPRYLKYSMKNGLGIRIVPGFNITPSTRVIAEVGYLFLQTEINVIDLTTVPTFSTTSVTENKGVVVYGAGLETMLYESFGIRASYNVAPRMGTVDNTGSATSITNTHGTVTYTASPALGFFYLGGVIRFGF
jgi:hypothetical protein